MQLRRTRPRQLHNHLTDPFLRSLRITHRRGFFQVFNDRVGILRHIPLEFPLLGFQRVGIREGEVKRAGGFEIVVERKEAEVDVDEGVFVLQFTEEEVRLGGVPCHGCGGVGDFQGLAFDEFDVGGVFAKGFYFRDADFGGSVELFLRVLDLERYFGEVEACARFVLVLKLEVVCGLGFHVGDAAWQGENTVGFVEGGDGVRYEPEICALWQSAMSLHVWDRVIWHHTSTVGFWQSGASKMSLSPLDMDGGFKLFSTAPTASS